MNNKLASSKTLILEQKRNENEAATFSPRKKWAEGNKKKGNELIFLSLIFGLASPNF